MINAVTQHDTSYIEICLIFPLQFRLRLYPMKMHLWSSLGLNSIILNHTSQAALSRFDLSPPPPRSLSILLSLSLSFAHSLFRNRIQQRAIRVSIASFEINVKL